LEAERRHVVILFADMVGFTAFSERFGEEAAFGLIQRLSQIVEGAVEVEGARVHNIAGDGMVVAFGASIAVEDAPLRACRAALLILETLKAAGTDFEVKYAVRPEMRIGSTSDRRLSDSYFWAERLDSRFLETRSTSRPACSLFRNRAPCS
jgi:class 3 adenylate cyclase